MPNLARGSRVAGSSDCEGPRKLRSQGRVGPRRPGRMVAGSVLASTAVAVAATVAVTVTVTDTDTVMRCDETI